MTATAIKQGRFGWLWQPVELRPLIAFRIAFGLVMAWSCARYLLNGWADAFQDSAFHFTFVGFEWVRPLPGAGMNLVLLVLMLAALGIALGWRYRLSSIVFFVLFTYLQLIDLSLYLNHYYLAGLLSFWILWMPLNGQLSLDARRDPRLRRQTVPAWMLYALRLQIGLVYFYAGVAKLNPDWLLHGMPMRLWLLSWGDLPLVGGLLTQPAAALLMSWGGALYDLSITFLLLLPRTRWLAFAAVIVFHLLTALLFPMIGLFPWIMMGASLVFLPAAAAVGAPSVPAPRFTRALLGGLMLLQLVLPLRHWLYPGDVLWTEEGFRLSWRVMLVDKVGDVVFYLHDPQTGRRWQVWPETELTPFQARQMSFQPDMILQYAHHLETQARAAGSGDIEVRAEAWVAFNGRSSRLLIDPTVDLTLYPPSLLAKPFILPLEPAG